MELPTYIQPDIILEVLKGLSIEVIVTLHEHAPL